MLSFLHAQSISTLFSLCTNQDSTASAQIKIPFSVFQIYSIDHTTYSTVQGTVGDTKLHEPWPLTLGASILTAKG